MLNEADHCSIRLIDLQLPMTVETAATTLDQEFEQPDDEQEIALTRNGERYALRLRIEPRPDAQEHAPIETPTLSLGFQFPGQLRNLRWEAHPRRELAADHRRRPPPELHRRPEDVAAVGSREVRREVGGDALRLRQRIGREEDVAHARGRAETGAQSIGVDAAVDGDQAADAVEREAEG